MTTDKLMENLDEEILEEDVRNEAPAGESRPSEKKKRGFVGSLEHFFKNIPAYLRTALRVFCGWFGFGVFGGPYKKKRKKIFFDVIGYVILIVGGVTMLRGRRSPSAGRRTPSGAPLSIRSCIR